MGGHIELEVNNGQTLFLTQVSKDGDTILTKWDGEAMTSECSIPAGDMVMLLNLYRHVKNNDIRNDFINPNGKNKEMFFYGMRLRGFSPGCQPMNGFVERKDDPSGRYYDILVYDHKLSDREIANYELDPVQDDALQSPEPYTCEDAPRGEQ